MATTTLNNIDTGGGKEEMDERAIENRSSVLRNSNSEGGVVGSDIHGTNDATIKESSNSLRQVMSEVKSKTGVDIDIEALLDTSPDKTFSAQRVKPTSASSEESTFLPNDLKSLQNKYDPRKSVNMSHILEEYGYPPKDVEKFRQQKKTKKLIDKYSSQKDDAEREAQKEREKREKYIRVYEEVHKLKNYYYEEYTDALREKIEKQRQEIQKRTEHIENKLREKENKDKAAAIQSRRLKSYKVTLTHDDDFLKQIPVSQFYKILLFQDRLKKEGRLKTQIDVDNFWHVIRQHHKRIHDMADLNRYLITKKSKKTIEDQIVKTYREQESWEERDRFPNKYRPRVSDIMEDSRPSTSREQPWAITQMAKTKHKEKCEEKDHLLIAKEAAMALEKKYPQLHLPELSCFTLCVGAKTPKPQEMIDQLEARRRQKERLLYVTRVRRMYQLAGANIASTKRIMAKNDSEFPVLKHGAAVGDKINSEYMEPFKVEYEEPPPEPEPWLKYIPEPQNRIYPIEEITEMETLTTNSSKSKKSKSRSADETNRERPQSSAKNKDPLQMKFLMKEDKVMEATCLSTMWKNYLGAGKSAFARD